MPLSVFVLPTKGVQPSSKFPKSADFAMEISNKYVVKNVQKKYATSQIVVLRHLDCDGIFTLRYKNFAKNPICRCCENIPLEEHRDYIALNTNGKFKLYKMGSTLTKTGQCSKAYILTHQSPDCTGEPFRISAISLQKAIKKPKVILNVPSVAFDFPTPFGVSFFTPKPF